MTRMAAAIISELDRTVERIRDIILIERVLDPLDESGHG
jgi:hypothetical protein